MAYRYRYINRLAQYGRVNYTLLLEDLEVDPVKTVRIEKSFPGEIADMNDDFLYEEARKEIIRVNQEDENAAAAASES